MPWWAEMPLPHSVPSAGELSGARIPASIDGFNCSILFPRRPDKGWGLLPPEEGPWDQAGIYWGGVIASVRGPGEQVKGLGLEFPDSPGLEESNLWKLQLGSASWQADLLDWLAVLHGQPALSITIEPGMLFLVEDPDFTPLSHYEPDKFVTVHTWQRAILHASQGDAAPLKLVLVHRATKAFFEEDYRLAVINAATAVELAVTQAIGRRLAPAGADAAEAVLKQVRMLGARIALARKSGIQLPNSTEYIAEVRNEVVHRGEQPKHRDAGRVLEIATEVVNALMTDEEIRAE
jgi:hypothetical protein